MGKEFFLLGGLVPPMGFSDFLAGMPSPGVIERRLEGFSSWLEVDLDAIGHNLEAVRRLTGVEVFPCLKKNAYGHGVAVVAGFLSELGVGRVLVGKLWEAWAVREAGLDVGVVNLEPVYSLGQARWLARKRVSQVVYQEAPARLLSEAAVGVGGEAGVWVKVDTGLGRVGVGWREAPDYLEWLSGLPGLRLEGVFTTLAEGEEDMAQVRRLVEAARVAGERGVEVPCLSASSSYGILLRPGSYLDAVRPGVMLFGWLPVPEAGEVGVRVCEALTLKARLEHVKTVEAGTRLTYGGAFEAPRRMRVGTLHIGYSDGYLRQLGGRGLVWFKGGLRGVVGGVSINHMLVDLTGVEAEAGEVVEAVRPAGGNSVASLCSLAGVEPYQFAVWLNPLTPRVYLLGGEPVALVEGRLGVGPAPLEYVGLG